MGRRYYSEGVTLAECRLRMLLLLPHCLVACGRFEFAPVTDASDAGISSRGLGAGDDFACAVTDGVLRCWGTNTFGQLGTGDVNPQPTATLVAQDRLWRTVTTGRFHACAIDLASDLYCWGDNANGQLGLGDLAPRSLPERVTLPLRPVSIKAGFENTCAVLEDSSLMCWGDNAEGQLGRNDVVDSPVPVAPLLTSTWQDVASGQAHTLAIATDGTMWGSGRNVFNELGLPVPAPGQRRVMTQSAGGTWIDAAAGQNHSCAIATDGTLHCWGDNMYGGLGVNDTTARDLPTPVVSSLQWSALATHTFHTCAISTTGGLSCWGRGVEGQIGTGNNMDQLVPVDVSLSFSDWIAVSVGRFYSCAMRADGSVWCTGANNASMLGTGDTMRRTVFTQVAF